MIVEKSNLLIGKTIYTAFKFSYMYMYVPNKQTAILKFHLLLVLNKANNDSLFINKFHKSTFLAVSELLKFPSLRPIG